MRRRITAVLMALAMTAALTACGSSQTASPAPAAPAASTPAASAPAASAGQSVPTGVEDGVLTVAMECAYAPYN